MKIFLDKEYQENIGAAFCGPVTPSEVGWWPTMVLTLKCVLRN